MKEKKSPLRFHSFNIEPRVGDLGATDADFPDLKGALQGARTAGPNWDVCGAACFRP